MPDREERKDEHMRLAIISDIHGNEVALEATLNSIAEQGLEDIICLGDVAASGPQPRQVVARLKAVGCPVVMGNTDAWLLKPEMHDIPNEAERLLQDIDLWCAEQLSPADQSYLATFQPTIEFPLVNGSILLCYHGSPRSYDEGILSTTPDEILEHALPNSRASVFAGGHTHLQMFRRYRDALLLNPGSVGLPVARYAPINEVRNPPWAEYAALRIEQGSLSIEMHRVPFDPEILIQTALSSGMPHVRWWIDRRNRV